MNDNDINGSKSINITNNGAPSDPPTKLVDLDHKKYLIVYDTQGQAHEGTKVELVYGDHEWVLTIQLLSTKAFKSFNDSEISSITRCT